MTPIEQVTLLRELVAALNDVRQSAFDGPRKSDTLRHLEWAIDEIAQMIWIRGTDEAS